MKSKINFFMRRKKVLWIFGIISAILIVIYLLTFNLPPIANLSVDIANSIWSIIINLSCGYLISLIFYIMLVLDSDYNNYLKRENIAKFVYNYYARLDTYIDTMFEIIIQCSQCQGIQDYIDKTIKYHDIKEKIICYDFNKIKKGTKCDRAFKMCVNEANKNLNEIEPYLIFLNKEAIDIYMEIQKTYIFENVNESEKIFNGAVDSFLENLFNVHKELRKLNKGGYKKIIEE